MNNERIFIFMQAFEETRIMSIFNTPDPFTELHCVGHCSTQQDDANMVWQHDEHFLPHDPPLRTQKAQSHDY